MFRQAQHERNFSALDLPSGPTIVCVMAGIALGCHALAVRWQPPGGRRYRPG